LGKDSGLEKDAVVCFSQEFPPSVVFQTPPGMAALGKTAA